MRTCNNVSLPISDLLFSTNLATVGQSYPVCYTCRGHDGCYEVEKINEKSVSEAKR